VRSSIITPLGEERPRVDPHAVIILYAWPDGKGLNPLPACEHSRNMNNVKRTVPPLSSSAKRRKMERQIVARIAQLAQGFFLAAILCGYEAVRLRESR